MKISKIIPLGIFAATLALAGCGDEGKLKPSSEPEPCMSQHELPQGNNPYDAEILDFYDTYKSVILYKFTEQDFGWNVTNNLTWTTPPAGQSINFTLYRLAYDDADPNYIQKQFDLFMSKFVDYYPAEFIQKAFPRVVLFTSNLYQLPQDFEGTPTEADKTYMPVFFSTYNMVVGLGNAKLNNFTTADRNQFSSDINYGYVIWLLNNGSVDSDFMDMASYSQSYSSAPGTYGFLSAASVNNNIVDRQTWAREVVSKSEAEFAAAYLTRSYDRNGRVRARYDALLNAFKVEGVDLTKVGNDRETE